MNVAKVPPTSYLLTLSPESAKRTFSISLSNLIIRRKLIHPLFRGRYGKGSSFYDEIRSLSPKLLASGR